MPRKVRAEDITDADWVGEFRFWMETAGRAMKQPPDPMNKLYWALCLFKRKMEMLAALNGDAVRTNLLTIEQHVEKCEDFIAQYLDAGMKMPFWEPPKESK